MDQGFESCWMRNYHCLKENVAIIYIYKEDCLCCLSVSVCLDAFAQFSRYRAETLQVGQGGPGTGRGGVKNFGGSHRGGGLGWAYTIV